MSRPIHPGDRVFDVVNMAPVKVIRVYPEVNTAIIETDDGVEKAHIDDLIPMTPENTEPVEEKKKTLLGRIKAKFSGR